jgi:hypothetical protein
MRPPETIDLVRPGENRGQRSNQPGHKAQHHLRHTAGGPADHGGFADRRLQRHCAAAGRRPGAHAMGIGAASVASFTISLITVGVASTAMAIVLMAKVGRRTLLLAGDLLGRHAVALWVDHGLPSPRGQAPLASSDVTHHVDEEVRQE